MSLMTPPQRGSHRKPDITLVADDVYGVLSEFDTLGFIHKVGNIFVALDGDTYSHAVEIGQCHSWDEALTLVMSH